MIDFAQQRDAVGFANYMASHNCPVLQAGTTAVYEDSAYSGRAMCIRPLGASDCFWIPSAAAQEISHFSILRMRKGRAPSGQWEPTPPRLTIDALSIEEDETPDL